MKSLFSFYTGTSNQYMTATVTYDTVLYSSGYQLVIGMLSYYQYFPNNTDTLAFNITAKNLRSNSFTLNYTSIYLRNTAMVRINYICIDNYIKNLYFYVINNHMQYDPPLIVPSNTTISINEYNFTDQIRNMYLTSGTRHIVFNSFLKGVEVQNTLTNTFSIILDTIWLNQSFYKVNIINSPFYSQQNLSRIDVFTVIFNKTKVGTQKTLLQAINFQLTLTNTQYVHNSTYLFNTTSTFVALLGLSFQNTLTIAYNINIDFLNSTVILTGSSLTLQKIPIFIINVEKRQCLDPNFTYYMDLSHLCYDTCPVELYYQQTATLRCLRCLYDCYKCVDYTYCVQCNATWQKRQEYFDLAGRRRCKPLSGYYNTKWSDTIAQRCDTNCVQCFLNSTNCTVCVDGKYLNYNVVDNTNSCQPCRTGCATCLDSTSCLTCQNLYRLDGSSVCVFNCSVFCSTCHKVISLSEYLVCDVCHYGYFLNTNLTSDCYSVCGDGYWGYLNEQCDDGNLQNLDGCNSRCKLQPGYQCNNQGSFPPINSSASPQTCYYTSQIKLSVKKFIKSYSKNLFQITLSVETINRYILKQLYWSRILSINLQFLTFVLKNINETYQDPTQSLINTLQLTFQITYQKQIPNLIQLTINPTLNKLGPLLTSASIKTASNELYLAEQPLSVSFPSLVSTLKFDFSPISKYYFSFKTNNGLAVIYITDSFLTLSLILQYLFQLCALITLISVFISLTHLGGKIIALQFFFIVNICYFSLLGFSNLQIFPTIKSISGLKLIALNVFTTFEESLYNESNKFWWTGESNSYLTNCVLLMGVLIVPFLVFGVAFLLKKCTKDTQNRKVLIFIQRYSVGQLLMTFYLIGVYSFVINLGLCIYQMLNSSEGKDPAGIGIGFVLFFVGIFEFIFFIKKKQIFWQFKNPFYKQKIAEYYMNFHLIFIWLNSIFMVALCNVIYSNIATILFSSLQILWIYKVRPYRSDIQNRRPIILLFINILLQCLFLTLKIQLSQKQQQNTLNQISSFFLYMPIIILIVLYFTLTFTLYHLIKKMKIAYNDRKQFLENEKFVKQKLKQSMMNTLSCMTNAKNEINFQKEIIDKFQKQNSREIIKNMLVLQMDKKEIQEKWEQVNNIDINRQQIKKIKKQILKKSTFLQNNSLKDYFKVNFNLQDQQNGLTSQSQQSTYKRTLTKNSSPQTNKKHQKQKFLQKCLQKPQQICPQPNPTSCLNCHQPLPNSSQPYQSHPSDQNQTQSQQPQQQQWVQQWRQFFKQKSILQQLRKQNKSIYDMI